MTRASKFLVVLGLAITACNTEVAGPRATPPTASDADDAAFSIDGLRNWYLIGDEVTPGHNELTVTIKAPEGTQTVDMWIGDNPGQRLQRGDSGFSLSLPTTSLPAGDYQILFAANGETTAFAKRTIHRSAPYYFLMTTDWDFSEPGDAMMQAMDAMRIKHQGLPMTHFVGPYTYTDPALTSERRTAITSWLKQSRDTHGDEIALHIHPYCNFVSTTSVPCITDQSTVYAKDDTGYTIKVAAYTEQDFGTLLDAADALFVANGLGKPVTFRAGGWTADAGTFRALASHGYVADTSALNWARLEEWKTQGTGELYRWNMANWLSVGDTSQPYYPSAASAVTTGPDALPMLEVPDNGIMVDYVSVDEMKQISNSNWNGNALAVPKTLMLGFHPSLRTPMQATMRVDGIVTYAEEHLAKLDRGPMVYAVLKDMPRVFKK
jgi:hypothetical protein